MRYKRSAIFLSALMCLASRAGALVVYTESNEAQFTAGSHSSTYLTGTGSNVNLGLDYYGHGAGLSAPGPNEWFNADWKYRQSFTINSTNPSTLLNYPVAITLNTQAAIAAGRMNADGSDLRFTTAAVSGSSPSLPYYIESGINTTATKIWVRLPSAANGVNNLYIYSGSTSAASASSMPGTFAMGDNFTAANGAAPDAGNWGNIESAAPASGSLRDIQSNRLRLLFGSPLNQRFFGLRSSSQYSFAAGRHYRADINARTSGGDSWSSVTLCPVVYSYSYDRDDWLRLAVHHSAAGATYSLERSDYGSRTVLASGALSAGFHGLDFLINASSFTVLMDGSQIYSAANNLSFNSPYIYLEAANANASLDEFLFDNVSVQAYSSPEPAYGSPGLEEGRRYPSGSFTSQAADTGSSGSNFQLVDWASVMPSSSSLNLEMRAHDTNVLLGTFTSVSKGGNPGIAGRYVQYRLNLATLDPRYTATISSIALTYGSPPLAPTGVSGTTLSEYSIKWSWTDNSSGQYEEDGFRILDASGSLKGSVTAGTTYWTEVSLNPNTQYSRLILGYNSSGSGLTTLVAKYTLPSMPSVACDKSVSTWLSGTITCSNTAGWGNNGVTYYRYVWSSTNTYPTWTGTETQWTSGTLPFLPGTSGEYFLHIKSYNADGVSQAAYQTVYGPYWWDKAAPTVTDFSPSSAPWTQNTGFSVQAAAADSGGSTLNLWRYQWTTTTGRPGSGWLPGGLSIINTSSSTLPFTTPGTAAQWYLHVEAEDQAGNTGWSYTGPYKIDTTAPGGSISINAGAAYTPQKEVTLTLTYTDSESGVKEVSYRNVPGSFTTPELPQATSSWTLIAGDGLKTVAFQVFDNAGKYVLLSDTIQLDSKTTLLGAPVSQRASGVMGEPAETFDAAATLSWTPTGAVLAGKPLTFIFRGSTQTGVTDQFGTATASFNAPTTTGTYTYAVYFSSFSIDGTYTANNTTGTITATQRQTSLVTEDVNTTSNAGFTAKATLMDLLTGNLIIGSTVSFTFEGSTKTAITNGIGVATVTFTAPAPVGFYDYSASYSGSATYAAKNSTSRIGVGLRVTSLIVPGLSPLAMADFTAQATLMDGAIPVAGSSITFIFQGSTLTAITSGVGVASVTFTAPASSGSYSYSADFAGDGTYAASSGNGTVSVGLRPLTLAGDIVQGYVNATFQARAVLSDGITSQKVGGKAIVFLFEGSSATVVTDSNGVSTAVFNSGSLPRSSTCYYYFAGDSSFGFADSTGTVSIERRPVALSASDTSGLLNSTFTAIAELKDTAFTPTGIQGKTITFSFLGSTKTAVTDAIGVASVTYQTGISTGSYDFYATFPQDSVYLADNDTGTVTMDKRPVTVSAYPSYASVFNSLKLVADLKDGITGDYISSQTIVFNYDGIPQSTTTSASSGITGRANAVYPSTGAAGTYSFYADYTGNSLYSANSSTASITVTPRSINLSAFPQTAIWSTTFTATAELRDGITNALVSGKAIKLTFSTSTTNAVTTSSGVVTSTFTAPASTGTFNWLAEFAGDAAYSPASSTGTITVIRRAPTLTSIASSKNVWDSVLLSASFFDEGTPIASQQLSFFFMGSTMTAYTNGSGIATAGPFTSISTPGVYGFTAQFAGNTNYSAQTSSSTLSVSARLSNMNLGPVTVIANSSVTLSATLLDTNWGTPITGKTVSFTLQGATYAVSAVTNGSGIASAGYISSLVTGAYTYSATFSGNTNYYGTSSSDTVTVTVRPSVLEMADYYPPASSTFTASAVLKDFTSGATISTKTVSFLFLGVTKTPVTNGIGVASTSYVALSSTMSYPISASFAGDTLYGPASINKVVFPGRRNTSLLTSDMLTAVAKDTFTVTGRLSDYDLGVYLGGQTITFSFSGSTYTLNAVTDSTGMASVSFTAPASTGNYTYNATFAGTSLYNGTFNTSSVLVNRRNISINPAGLTGIPATSTFTASALIKDGLLTVSTKTLSFIFITTKTAVTNGIGVASTTFIAPLSTGTFAYAVSYPGDALYNPALAYGSVGVILKPTVMVVLDVPDAVVGLGFVGTGKLQDVELGSLVLSTKTISFTFTTTTVNSVTSLGIATTSLTAPLIVGTYTYTATFAGDGTYGPSQSTGTVTVKRRPVIFSVDVPTGEPYTLSTFTVKGTLVDGKTGEPLADRQINIYFKVANATHTLQTDAVGVATTSFYSGISSGSYLYSGTFAGDASYDASEINEQTVKTIKINQRPTSIQPFLADGQLMTWGVYTFNNFNTTVVMQDNLNGNSGIPGLTVNFIVEGSTRTGVSAANGQAQSGSAFPYIQNSGIYPATVRFDGNQTYAPSLLVGGAPNQIPLEGFVRVYTSPANIAMDSIQETYPDQDTVISGVAHDGYLGDRPAARPLLKGLQVRYRISDTPCNPYPTNCPWGTLGTPVWSIVNDSYIATATVHSPTEIGDYPIERWFATTSSFYYWEVTEDKRVLRVGLRPTAINIATGEPLEVGAQMPITIKVKLASTSQGNIGVVGKTVVITFNGGAPQNVTTISGGYAQYTFAGLPVGNYTYTATFAGDTAYNSTALSPVGNVSVVKNTTFLVGTPVTNVPAGNDFTAKATLNVLVGTAQEPAAGRTIDFTFPGNASSSSVTNAQGIAQVTFTSPQTPGEYIFTADLPTNANDLAASAVDPTRRVQVIKRRTSLVSVAVNPVYILDNFTSTATLADLDAPPSFASLIGQTINFTLHRGGAEGDIAGGNPTIASPLGQATKVFLSPATSGAKSYTAAFAGDTLYAAVTASDAGVNVLKRPTLLSASVEPTTPTNTIFTATVTLKDVTPTLPAQLPMGTGVHVPVKFVYNGITNYGTTDDFGVATATFAAQAASGDYTCDITYEGNNTYASYNMPLTVHVIKRTTNITGTAILNQPAGADFTASATLTDNYSGSGINLALINFVFTGGGTFNDSGTTDVSGITSVIFTAPLSTGVYNYTACFPGDDTYAASCDNSNSVTVDVASTTISTVNGTVVVNDAGQTADVYQASATLKGMISGQPVVNKSVQFVYGGVSLGTAQTDVSGVATMPITPLSTGSIRLDVIFAGDPAFYSSTSSSTITVLRRITTMDVVPVFIPIDDVFNATATLTDVHASPNLKVSGKLVDFYLNGTDKKTAYTNSLGIATVTYQAQSIPGNMIIISSFTGDAIYVSSNNTGLVSVSKRNSVLALTTATSLALDVFGATATLKNDLGTELIIKNIHFVYKGTPQDIATDGFGQAYVEFPAGSASGLWELDATFDGTGDTQYNTSNASGTITVLKRTCIVRPDNITTPVMSALNAGATMYDLISSAPVSGKTVSYGFNWDPSTYTAATDGLGVANRAFTAPTSSGIYRVETFFVGDATYKPSLTSTATVTVVQRPTQLALTDVNTMIGRVFTATATLKNDGVSLGDKYILFTFEGKTFNVKTGTGGSLGIAVATFTVTVSTGATEIDAVFNGDGSYSPSNASSATVTAAMRPTTVIPSAATVSADKVFIATATLKDIDNLNVQGQQVSFTFDGNTFYGNTNSIGIATVAFTATVATGTYNIPVTFDGNYKYITSSATITLTVIRRATSLTSAGNVTIPALDVFTDTVTLRDLDNITLPSQSLRFVFQGSTFTKSTDGSGIASSTFTAPAAAATYFVNVYFDGDAKYAPSSTAITITAQKRLTAISLNNLSGTALDLITTTATITDQNNPAFKVSTKTVTFSFSWGASTAGVTDGVGLATAAYQATAAAGSYTLTGTFAGDATYASTTTIVPLTIFKRNGYVTGVFVSTRVFDVFAASGTFYDSVTSNPVSGRTMTFILQHGSTFTAVTNGSGVATVDFTAPASSGTYGIYVSNASGDITYNPVTVYVSSVTLARRNSYINLSAPTASIINSSFTAIGVMKDSVNNGLVAARTLSFLFQGSTVPAVTNGSGQANAGYTASLSSGTYPMQVSFAGDASYNPSVSSSSIITLRYPTHMAGPAITVTMNEVLTATVTFTDYQGGLIPAGTLNFNFEGSPQSAVTNAIGVASTSYTASVASGTYQLPVSFAGDALYESTNTSIPVLVNKRNAQLTPDPVTVQALNIFTASATLVDALNTSQKLSGQTVSFNFLVGASTVSNSGVTDINGMAVSTFSAPADVGSYQVRAYFAGDPTYYPRVVYGAVTVLARPSKLMQDSSSAAIDEIFRTTATLVDLATSQIIAVKTINFTYGASSAALTDGGGKASVTFTAPSSSGAYQLNSSFSGDTTYAPATSTATLTVIRRPALMSAPDISGRIDEVFTATATMTDGLNAAFISARPLKFVFSGSTFTSLTDSGGLAVSTFSAPASSGTYYASINFSGDSRYLPAGTTVQLTADRRISGIIPEPVSVRAGDIFTATATLRDIFNPAYKPSGLPLKFIFAGSTFTALTDSNGIAVSTFTAPLSSGPAQLDLSFSGDSRYIASAATTTVTVLRRLSLITIDSATIQAMEVLTATATLSDKMKPGIYAEGRALTFTFSGVDFSSVTNAGGVAVSTFTGPVSSGTYIIEANFEGDAFYEDSYSSGSVVVIQRPAGVTVADSSAYPFEPFTAGGTMKDLATDTPVAGRRLNFDLDGSLASAVTSGVGLATAPYTPPGAFGDYQLSADFPGDETYAAAAGTGTVSVMQRPTSLASPDAGTVALDLFIASATLTDIRFSTIVAGKDIVFLFEGQSSTGTTNAGGSAWAEFSAPVSSGVYFYTAQFNGDATYAISSTTGAITVDTRYTRIVARDANANVGEPFTLSAQLLDPAKEDLPGYYVPNVPMHFVFKDRNNIKIDEGDAITNELGIATVTFSGPQTPDVYYYTASFEGDVTYSSATATAMLKVGLLTSLVAFDADTMALEDFTVKAKLTDYLSTTLDDKPVRFTFLGNTDTGLTYAQGASGIAQGAFTAPPSSGTYFYNAYFDGDSIYSASNATGTITVQLRKSYIQAPPVSTLAYSSFTALVTLKDVLSDANIGGRNMSIAFQGSTFPVVTDLASGEASATFFVVSSGTLYYSVSFDGDGTYSGNSTTGTVNVTLKPTSMLSYNVTDVLASSTFTAKIQVKDNFNQPIKDLSVDFDFEGSFNMGMTDAQGIAETIFTAPAASGTYAYTAIFYGDQQYDSSSASGDVTVGPRPTLLLTSPVSSKLGSPLALSAKLLDVAGQAGLANKTVSFVFDGTTITALTDSMGISTAAFGTPASTGTFAYEAFFAGDEIVFMGSYSSSTVTIALNLTTIEAKTPISIKIHEPLDVDAKLRDSIGLNLPGMPIVFTLEGIDQPGVTDGVGIATTTFQTLGFASTGTYSYTAQFLGDSLYVASIDTANVVNISRRETLLTPRDAVVPPNKSFTAEARFYDNVNSSIFTEDPLPGKTIIFELHDSTFTTSLSAVTSALGISTVSFVSPASTGTFVLTARFADGDPVYESALSSAAITVLLDDGTGAIKTKLHIDAVNTYINRVFTASGTLTATDVPVSDMAILFEFFNGIATYTAAGFTDTNGLAVSTFTAPSSSGTYIITASYAGDGTYSAATGTSTVSAARYPDTLAAQPASALSGETFPAKAVLLDGLTLAPITGSTITFNFFNGVSTITKTAVTSSTGSAETSFNSPVTPGDYFYTALFAGNTTYVENADTAAILIASRGSSTFLVGYNIFIGTGEVVAASATLTSQGYPVQGKAVTITFQGLSRISTTNAQGLAFSTFTAPSSSGTFAYQAEFFPDADYNAALATAAVSVVFRKKAEAPVFKVAVTSTAVTLAWTPVTMSSAQVTGYTIEESASLRGVRTSSAAVAASTASVMGYTMPVDENTATYLKIKTKLADDQESQTTLTVEIPSKAEDPLRVPNYYYMSPGANPQDWAAWVRIPGKVMDKVSAAAPFAMSVEKETNPQFLAAYNITASADSETLKEDMAAGDRKGVKLTIAYPQSGTGTSAAGEQLALYWFNGAEWIKIGGEIDVLTGEIYTYSRVLGQFAVKAAPLASVFTLTKVVPRVFSPDDPSPTVNRVTFSFENPGGGEVTIRIFDITGALVRRNLDSQGFNMYWDGKDQSGALVKGGIYIYQLEASDKVLTGTVVVAK